eukprot:gene742-4036_t
MKRTTRHALQTHNFNSPTPNSNYNTTTITSATTTRILSTNIKHIPYTNHQPRTKLGAMHTIRHNMHILHPYPTTPDQHLLHILQHYNIIHVLEQLLNCYCIVGKKNTTTRTPPPPFPSIKQLPTLQPADECALTAVLLSRTATDIAACR